MTLVSHKDEYLEIDVLNKHTQETRRLDCVYSLGYCAQAFDNLWPECKRALP